MPASKKGSERKLCQRKDTCYYGSANHGGLKTCDYILIAGKRKEGYGPDCPHYKKADKNKKMRPAKVLY